MDDRGAGGGGAVRIEWETMRVETADPFTTSRSTSTEVERVWVRIGAAGVEGWGEADPSRYYGESAATVEAALGEMRPAVEEADGPEPMQALERELDRRIGGNRAAKAAVVAALLDLRGKAIGEPLWRLWGLDPGEAPLSSFTVGMDDPEAVAGKIERAPDYPVLKVKLGGARDEEILAAVRGAAPDRRIRVDANAAWSPKEALWKIGTLADHGVEFVEQPLPPEDRDGLRMVYERSPLPVILDESCRTASDVPGLAGLADGVNIKLAKCGGPLEALRAIHAARACSLRVMMGCMLETTLGIAPATHLAPLLDYADLDGAALLGEDPFRGPGIGEDGRIRVSDEPGLGVSLTGESPQ